MASRTPKRIFARRRRRRPLRAVSVWLALALIAAGAAAALETPVRSALSCDIKGNVSQRTGERIYHAPGQAYYAATRIDLFRGERWFCSEADAVAAGWRRSMR